MKKIILVALLVTTVLLTGCSKKEVKEAIESQQTENHDFRNVNWGDSIEDVKNSESGKILKEDPNSLVYKISVSNYSNVLLVYYFDDKEKLYSGTYGFDFNTNSGQDIERYNLLKSSLTEIYGEPKTEDVHKISDKSDNPYISKEDSLERGYVDYSTTWESNNTKVSLLMKAKDYKVTTVINYTDINNQNKLNNDIKGL